MRFGAFLLFVVLPWALKADSLVLQMEVKSPTEIRGAAAARDGRIFTWGDGLQVRTRFGGEPRRLAAGYFGEGGCLVDVDGDGREEFVGKEDEGLGRLTWRRPPDFAVVETIDTQFDTHDCIGATLFGRRGVLVVQRYMQVRFYERVSKGKWRQREIYSIYTPSQQTGLSMADVNGDGRPDIYCGNYWIQSPKQFDLPWHIFAINLYYEDPDSAMLAHEPVGAGLFVAQAHRADARVAMFERPEDPRQLWKETRIPGRFHRVHAAETFNGRVVFAENNGSDSRTFELQDGHARELGRGFATLRFLVTAEGLVAVGPHAVALWK